MRPNERRQLHEAVADAKNCLMRALRIADSVRGGVGLSRRIGAATARVELIQNQIKKGMTSLAKVKQ